VLFHNFIGNVVLYGISSIIYTLTRLISGGTFEN
jgi:hypothetical protein